VATGILATLAPGQAVPTVVGPSLAAAVRESTTADAVSDPSTGLSVSHADLGAAGCVGMNAPGGTAAQADSWSVLGAVSGTTLGADLVPASGAGAGWHLRGSYAGLQVDGAPAAFTPGQPLAVGTWGTLETQVSVDAGAGQALRWWEAALALKLTRAHGGLPAGTTLLIGWVSANKPSGATSTPTPTPAPKPKPKPATKPKPKAPPTTTTTPTTTAATPTPAPKPKPEPKPAVKPKPKAHVKKKAKAKPRAHPKPSPGSQPLHVTPPLAAGTYDFPVTGNVVWGDTYGALRSDVPGGWHHGDDLFAPLGTPVVAVADGTVFSVGWNHVGGWRLWLRTASGDEFYYAHLSGYTATAQNNAHVHRGDVLGFVGNTGDAITTWPHLHFEIHPNELMYLGYNGAVDPSTYLDRWHHVASTQAPPPVRLPSSAGHGQGAVTDFHRLLALRPLKSQTPAPTAKAAVAAAPPRRSVPRRQAAAAAAAPTGGGSSDDGWGAVVAALVLVAVAAGAVAISIRNGRSS
jgi:murein DD-endopeptidase MepM/ murein hydrolase activator NlpD